MKKRLKNRSSLSAFGPKDPRYEIVSREGAYSPPSPSVPLFVRGRRNKKVPEDVHPQALCYSFTVIARRQFRNLHKHYSRESAISQVKP